MDSSGIRANMSSQHLISHEIYDRLPASGGVNTGPMAVEIVTADHRHQKPESREIMTSSSECSSGEATPVEAPRRVTRGQIITVSILCFVNLINYMDRFTIAGILTDIQKDFNIGDSEGGLLQTAFIASYMVFAPIFGYLGDRYSRKAIMAVGIFIWSLTTLLGSFMQSFWPFLAMRACVGIGEASYSTIAPTIISDLFVSDMRSKMLALFYFAIPVGSGLGYIVGSACAQAGGSWHWGLRVTPIAGALAVILIMTAIKDPTRGESEGSHLVPTSWADDIKSLFKNRSFMLSSLACTAVAFVAGSLSWWGPKFISLGLATQKDHGSMDMSDVAKIFGVTGMLSGLIGVPLGSFLGQKLRSRYPRADPLVCGAGMLLSVPLFTAGLFVAKWDTTACFAIIFFGQLFLNLNWAIVADMALYVVIPTRRSTAEAFQILLSHALGDAGSPYLIGQISEILKRVLTPAANTTLITTAAESLAGSASDLLLPQAAPLVLGGSGQGSASARCLESSISCDTAEVDFEALQYALMIAIFVEVLGAFFFIATAWYIVEDKAKVDRAVSEAARAAAERVAMKDDEDGSGSVLIVGSVARSGPAFDNPAMDQFGARALAHPDREPV